ncbi:hypothetical protein HH308_16610 [Gordonia sp. TBRC 11910]|uniref:Uncharacterized protein n=2 Tax=Gordonia asplenii TaxID=2725283 RepID=A0A848KVZ1_9ACTN|nr:hypothetical protein [Gordonia asplenii]
MLWAGPGNSAALTAYEDTVLALLPDHDAEVLSRVVGTGADGHPHEVQILRCASRSALDGYLADPRRTALSDERDRVIARTELFEVDVRV